MRVYHHYFQGQTKYTWATCKLNCYLMLLSRTVYSLTREISLAGCVLYIQTLTFPVLTLKQYVNAKTIWGSGVWNINYHEDYCQPLLNYATSIQLTFKVFAEKQVFLRTKSAFYPWSTVFSLHFTLSLHFTPSLQSAPYTDHTF